MKHGASSMIQKWGVKFFRGKFQHYQNPRSHILQKQEWKISWFVYLTLPQSLFQNFYFGEILSHVTFPLVVNWLNKTIVCVCVCMYRHVQSVWLFATLWTVVCQAPLSRGFHRQEYWSGLPCPSPEVLPNPGIKTWSPILQSFSLLLSHRGTYIISNPYNNSVRKGFLVSLYR